MQFDYAYPFIIIVANSEGKLTAELSDASNKDMWIFKQFSSYAKIALAAMGIAAGCNLRYLDKKCLQPRRG